MKTNDHSSSISTGVSFFHFIASGFSSTFSAFEVFCFQPMADLVETHFTFGKIQSCFVCVCDTNLTSIDEFSLFNLCHNGSRSHFSGSSSFFRSASIDHICNLMAIQSRVVFSLFVSRFRRVSKRECDQNYIYRENSPCQCVTANCRGCEGAHFGCLRAFFRLNSFKLTSFDVF